MMRKTLEKAHSDPESMKARILKVARQIFGDYGYHGTTTRMIAKEVGIDISTLHYHWGGKKDLYEAVVTDINDEIMREFIEVERIIHGMPLEKHIDVASSILIDYFYEHIEIPRMLLHRSVNKTRFETNCELDLYKFTRNIAISMKLVPKDAPDDPDVLMEVLALINTMITFIAGDNFLRDLLHLGRSEYVTMVKKTTKFMITTAFTQKYRPLP